MADGPKDYSAITTAVSEGLGGLREQQPEVLKAFGGLSRASMTAGALDKKTKELIALAIGVAKQCDACIGFHTQALRKLGASDAEVSEMLGVSVYMGGGPSVMYAADAWTAWTQTSD